MNTTIRVAVHQLDPRYKDKSDNDILTEIRIGNHAGDALFYLLFGRYANMLLFLFNQQARPSMEFDDFMLELDLRLFSRQCAALASFNKNKASFKTYLSQIAHNLLYDMSQKEVTMLDVETIQDSMFGVDSEEMFALMDAINTYPNPDSRYVLLKTIEGYKSQEIATMLSSRRHELGTLQADEELKASYIDTLRSRALKAIRRNLTEPKSCSVITNASYAPMDYDACVEINRIACPDSIEKYSYQKTVHKTKAETPGNLFIENIGHLYHQMMDTL